MSAVTIGGETFQAADFSGDNGLGHAEILPALTTRPSEPRFPDRIFGRFTEDLALVQQVLANSSFIGTSSSSVAIGTGDKTFTTQSGKGWAPGMLLLAVDTTAPTTNSIFGTVKSYSGTTLVITVPSGGTAGSGTPTSWSIVPKSGVMDGPTTSTDYTFALFNGASGKVLKQLVSWIADSSDNVSIGDKIFSRAVFKDVCEKVQPVTASNPTTTIDITQGNVISLAHGVDTTIALTNPSPTGNACWVHVIRTKDNSGTTRALTHPTTKWKSGTQPILTQTANAIDIWSYLTVDGGSTWLGFDGGGNFS